MSANPQVIGALVQKCSPDVPEPAGPAPTTALIGEHPGVPLSKWVDEGGAEGLEWLGIDVLISPVAHDPDTVVDVVPPELLAVTVTASAFPTSEDPRV